MKYMGSKSRIAKDILSIILQNYIPGQWYVEPFASGMNMICEVNIPNRLANDSNFYLIEMWKSLMNGWQPPKINKEEYFKIKSSKDFYPPELVGWVGFNCSYSGKWFGGFAGETKTKIGTIRDYQAEATKNVLVQIDKMKGVQFKNENYLDLKFPANSIIYCDPPYEGTTKYHDKFNHGDFWDWVRKTSKENSVYISEYNAP
jgi:DNA adenine methylase